MDQSQSDQSAWKYACEHFHFFPESTVGRFVELVVLATCSVGASRFAPDKETATQQWEVGLATALAGALAVAGLMFIWGLLRAPYAQRDAARRQRGDALKELRGLREGDPVEALLGELASRPVGVAGRWSTNERVVFEQSGSTFLQPDDGTRLCSSMAAHHSFLAELDHNSQWAIAHTVIDSWIARGILRTASTERGPWTAYHNASRWTLTDAIGKPLLIRCQRGSGDPHLAYFHPRAATEGTPTGSPGDGSA